MNAIVPDRFAAVLSAAAANADAVDRDGRFPAEAMAALRAAGLLGSMVPVELGGHGATLGATMAVCQALGARCGASGLILAMHHIQVACLLAHGGDAPWQRALLRRVAAEQLLLASVTSEATTGGAMRTSDCAVAQEGGRFVVEKRGPTVSYAQQADVLLVTARRDEAAGRSDQSLVAVLRADAELELVAHWDTMGMRGTCSHAVNLRAVGEAAQILPVPFGEIAEATMLPTSHLLWGAVWSGIAADALGRARAHLRRSMKPGGSPHPGARRLTEASGLLQMMQGQLAGALDNYVAWQAGRASGSFAALLGDMNVLKVSLSETALRVVQHALQVCGMAGYRNGTEFSLGRHLRDLNSAPLMINNDRISADTGILLAAQRSSLLREPMPCGA